MVAIDCVDADGKIAGRNVANHFGHIKRITDPGQIAVYRMPHDGDDDNGDQTDADQPQIVCRYDLQGCIL